MFGMPANIETTAIVRTGSFDTEYRLSNYLYNQPYIFSTYSQNNNWEKEGSLLVKGSPIVTTSSDIMSYTMRIQISQEDSSMDKPGLSRNLLQLDKIAALADNWNGNGAPAFSAKHIEMVRELLRNLQYQPYIFPTACQSIQIEYETTEEDYLEFEVFENGEVKQFSCSKDGEEQTKYITISEVNREVCRFYEPRISGK